MRMIQRQSAITLMVLDHSACSTWREMQKSGWRIGMILITTKVHLRITPKGQRTAAYALYVVVRLTVPVLVYALPRAAEHCRAPTLPTLGFVLPLQTDERIGRISFFGGGTDSVTV